VLRNKVSKSEQAVILVAGEGKRLRPFTNDRPKCFAEVAGRPIIQRALQALAENGCKKVTIVTGHMSHVVRERISDRYAGMDVRYVENPDFSVTNSMLSLALGLDGLEGSTWVLEGDVVFDPNILALFGRRPISWFADSARQDLDGAYLSADAENVAVSLNIMRDLSFLKKDWLKSVGILHLSQEGVIHLRQWLSEGIRSGRQNDYYDLILSGHLASGLVDVVDVAGHRWFEVDSPEDLDHANSIFL